MNRSPAVLPLALLASWSSGCRPANSREASTVPVLMLRSDGRLLPSLASTADAEDRGLGPTGGLEVIARFGDLGPSGVAVSRDGTIFVGFPRHADDHKGPTLGRLERGALIPFPDAAMSLPSPRPASARLVSVHGMTTDSLGRLWIIDDGKRAGHPLEEGGAKVVGFEPATGAVLASIVLRSPALRPESHMNDLRVDLAHGAKGTAFVTDSSFGTTPALVIVDIATGRQRRVLATHPSTQPEKGFVANLEGRPLPYDPNDPTFPVGGADGITLSSDGSRLYFAPLTSRRLYSIPTEVLADPSRSDAELASAVRDEGEKGFADGLASDAEDCIFVTDAEHDSILRRCRDGAIDVLARDPRILWPDGIFASTGYAYVTLGQWNRLPAFNGGVDLRKPPYLLVRIPIHEARR